MTLLTPTQGQGLLLNGNLEGLHLLILGCLLPVSGESLHLLTQLCWTGFTPFGRFALWLWYGVTRPSSTIINAIWLGFLLLQDRSFLRELMKYGQLTILPPYLVWCEVNNISAKTVFKEML